MLDQLTWSLGMLVQCTLVLSAATWLGVRLSGYRLAGALAGIAAAPGPWRLRPPSCWSSRRARELLGQLGSQLRARCAGSALVTLGEELELVRGHVALERARRGDALEFVEDIAAGSLARRVPRPSVQPLVENALRHGLGNRARGRVEVRARIEGGDLVVTVSDDGHGRTDGASAPGEGIGLANVRDRLASHCGSGASLALEGRPGSGATARMGVPPPVAVAASRS